MNKSQNQSQPKSSDILINELLNLDIKKVQGFSFNTMETYAKVIRCFDFNKLEVVFKFNNVFVRYICIINGIKDIQIDGNIINNNRNTEEGKKKLENLILNKIIYMKCHGFDKFGRIIIDLFQNNKTKFDNLN